MSTATATTNAPAAAAAKPKGKGRLLIVAAAVVLLGGAAAWFFMKPAADEKDAAHAEVKLPSQYIALEPAFVVNFEAGAAARFLQITVQLMTRDPHMVELLKLHDPAIRNDLLLLFGNQQVTDVSTREGKEKLRGEALEAIRKIISAEGGKPEELEAVYFTSFVMQ